MSNSTPSAVIGCLLDVSGSLRSALDTGHLEKSTTERLHAVIRAALKLAQAEQRQIPDALVFGSRERYFTVRAQSVSHLSALGKCKYTCAMGGSNRGWRAVGLPLDFIHFSIMRLGVWRALHALSLFNVASLGD